MDAEATYTTRHNIFQLVIDIWRNFQHLVAPRVLVRARDRGVGLVLVGTHRAARGSGDSELKLYNNKIDFPLSCFRCHIYTQRIVFSLYFFFEFLCWLFTKRRLAITNRNLSARKLVGSLKVHFGLHYAAPIVIFFIRFNTLKKYFVSSIFVALLIFPIAHFYVEWRSFPPCGRFWFENFATVTEFVARFNEKFRYGGCNLHSIVNSDAIFR